MHVVMHSLLYVGVSVMDSKDDAVGVKDSRFHTYAHKHAHTCTEYVITVLEWVIVVK